MPILGSFGTVNERAFGFGDSSFSDAYDLPISITNNALIVYDASNPDSYDGTSTTWYDISGNDNHSTWATLPTLNGSGGNKYLTADLSHILSIPDVLTNHFVYFMLLYKGSDKSVLGGYNGNTTWRMTRFPSDGMPYFESIGSGGDSRIGDSIPYENLPDYILYRIEVNGGGIVTRFGGISTYITSGRDYAGVQHSEATIGNGTLGSVPIKLLLLYEPENAPTIEQAYNALKGRFNL